ncbi:MAG: WD40 repeat domain-containing protein [Treponema sp.]|jgi:WD40 repeat protein|nr:WD40 repeat domain-containing protein [Treponema sp.]
MKYHLLSVICGLVLFAFLEGACLSAQSKPVFGESGFVLPQGHQGAVQVLIDDEQGRLLSAGADGFLAIWDVKHGAALDRFQLSVHPIHAMALRPGASQISVIGSDGVGIHYISAWDYEAKKLRFTLTFRDAISYINYSASGTYLIAVRNSRASVVFIHAETGEILRTVNAQGTVSFAATGKSERTMITYLPSGVLSYWDLESGTEIRHFIVPPQMQSPVLFGNNRFLGGIDTNGLVVLDAVSGAAIIRDRMITQGILLSLHPESSEFMGLGTGGGSSRLYHFNLTNPRKLEIKKQWLIPRTIPAVTSAVITANNLALGTSLGAVWLGKEDGSAKQMLTAAKNQRFIVKAGASGNTLAFLTQNQDLCFIPLDYTKLERNQFIQLERVSYTQITSGQDSGTGSEQFILWQDDNTRSFPVRRTLTDADIPITNLSLRFPLRSVALLEEKALFLDSLGNIKIISLRTGNLLFSFSSIAALDAVFLDNDHILIGRGAVFGDTPFLMVNITTGETVPLAYPASVGARVYLGSRKIPYGVAIEQQDGVMKTAILRLNITNPSLTVKLFETEGEDTAFGLAESNTFLAATLGGSGGFLYSEAESPKPLERSPGLPQHLIDGGAYLIAIDSEGSIAWHDPKTGTLLALFRLYENDWSLQRLRNTRSVVTGKITYKE